MHGQNCPGSQITPSSISSPINQCLLAPVRAVDLSHIPPRIHPVDVIDVLSSSRLFCARSRRHFRPRSRFLTTVRPFITMPPTHEPETHHYISFLRLGTLERHYWGTTLTFHRVITIIESSESSIRVSSTVFLSSLGTLSL